MHSGSLTGLDNKDCSMSLIKVYFFFRKMNVLLTACGLISLFCLSVALPTPANGNWYQKVFPYPNNNSYCQGCWCYVLEPWYNSLVYFVFYTYSPTYALYYVFHGHREVKNSKTSYYSVIQFYFVIIVSHQCEDHFQNCTYLALTGTCAKYSAWMTVHCGVSCNSCQGWFPFHSF